MKELAAIVGPETRAVAALAQEMTVDKAVKEIQAFGGLVFKTSLDETCE